MNLYVLLLAVVASLVVGRHLHRGFMEGRRTVNRTLSRRPRSRTASITEGLVRVTGHARPVGALLRAPVTGRPCVAFHVKIERKRGRSWLLAIEECVVSPFAVGDETGEALVDTNSPLELVLVPDAYGSEELFRRCEPEQMRLVRRLVRKRQGAVGFFDTLRFHEGIIEVDELISVGGPAAREPAPDGERPTPRAAPERLVFRGTVEEPLAISDWPQATVLEPGPSS